MSKRLISMLTVFTMLMTMISGAALATDDAEAFDLIAAVAGAEAGTEIVLTDDVVLTERLTISKALTIDLGGNTISANFADDYGAIYIGTAGDLTITGEGTITSANTYAVGNYGKLTVNGATLETTADGYAALYNFYFNDTTHGKAYITEGTFVGDVWNSGVLDITSGTFDYIDNSGYMTVADATINGLYGGNGEDAPLVENCGTIEFGGEVTIGNAELHCPVTVKNDVVLNIGGTITSDVESDYGAFYIGTAGDLTVNGGKITSTASYAVGNYGKLTVDGTTLETTADGYAALYNFYFNGATHGKAYITDGTFVGDVWNSGVLEITDGTFDYIDNSGYMTVADATINGLYGGNGEDAADVENCGTIELAGGEVVLGGDAELAAPIVVTGTSTLNIAEGKTISNTEGIWNVENKDWSLISVRGGDLTITGNGTLDAKEDDCYAVDVQEGTVTIENGTIIGNVSAVYVLKGTANIEGGTYSIKQKSTFDDERYTLNCLDENFRAGTADIIVTGGTFNKYNPAISNSENPEAVFVAEGYEAKQEGDNYVVSAVVIPEPPAPPVEDDDDDDDYTPSAPVVTPSVTVKDENGKAVEFEKQADGSLVVDTEEDAEFTVDTANGKDATVKYETEGKNYGLVAVIVNEDGTETIITDTIPTENGIEFTVKDGQTVKIVDNSQIFDDVYAGDWNHDAVTFAAARGIVNGVGDNKFEPTAAATRGMVMTMLARLSGVDTTGGETWFSEGMDWAKENGISDGTNPEAAISREQLIVMLWRLEGSPKANGVLNGFDDATDVSGWASDAMAWAVEKGLVQGNNGQLMPENNANRDQVAQILMNYILMK